MALSRSVTAWYPSSWGNATLNKTIVMNVQTSLSLSPWERQKYFLLQYMLSQNPFLYAIKALCHSVPYIFKCLWWIICLHLFFGNVMRAHKRIAHLVITELQCEYEMCFLVLLAALDHGTGGSLLESVYALICIAPCRRGYCCQMGFWWMFFTFYVSSL